MARLPTWEAAPRADSQSPKPPSMAARTRPGWRAAKARTLARSRWATETISRLPAGSVEPRAGMRREEVLAAVGAWVGVSAI